MKISVICVLVGSVLGIITSRKRKAIVRQWSLFSMYVDLWWFNYTRVFRDGSVADKILWSILRLGGLALLYVGFSASIVLLSGDHTWYEEIGLAIAIVECAFFGLWFISKRLTLHED